MPEERLKCMIVVKRRKKKRPGSSESQVRARRKYRSDIRNLRGMGRKWTGVRARSTLSREASSVPESSGRSTTSNPTNSSASSSSRVTEG